jgi:hypothetical protein
VAWRYHIGFGILAMEYRWGHGPLDDGVYFRLQWQNSAKEVSIIPIGDTKQQNRIDSANINRMLIYFFLFTSSKYHSLLYVIILLANKLENWVGSSTRNSGYAILLKSEGTFQRFSFYHRYDM